MSELISSSSAATLPFGRRLSRLANALWFVPLMILLPGGLGFVFAPASSFAFFGRREAELSMQDMTALGQMRILGVFCTTLAAILIFSQFSGSITVRRFVARILSVFFLFWSTTVLENFYWNPTSYDPLKLFVLAAMGYCSFVILVAQWRDRENQPTREDTGWATSTSVGTWKMWAAQGIFFVGSAAVIASSADGVVHAFTRPAAHQPYLTDQFRLSSCYMLTLGLFSFQAMAVHNDWLWRTFARVFAFLFGGTVLISFLSYSPLTWTHWILVWLVPVGIFLVTNLAALRVPRPSWIADVPEVLNGWGRADLLPGAPMALQVATKRRRASHLMGVGARGTFVVDPHAVFPEHDLFVAGTQFDLVMRFANLTLLDDAGLDVRGAALKLIDQDGKNVFDMVLNTGSFCPASNIVDFTTFVVSKWMPEWVSRKAIQKNAVVMEGAVAGLRRAPESFVGLHFYGQIVRGWLTPDNEQFLVRYRLIPAGQEPQTGFPDAADCAAVWKRPRRKTERRASNYLRLEFKERLAQAPVELILEAQFHAFHPMLLDDWYDAGIDWPEETHPWKRLGKIVLTAGVPDEEIERTCFNTGTAPASLFSFGSSGFRDPRSLGDSEARVMKRLQQLRLWLTRRHPPKFGPVANIRGADR